MAPCWLCCGCRCVAGVRGALHRASRVGVCHCLSCFVGGAVCEKSEWFDPVLLFDPEW